MFRLFISLFLMLLYKGTTKICLGYVFLKSVIKNINQLFIYSKHCDSSKPKNFSFWLCVEGSILKHVILGKMCKNKAYFSDH